MRRMHRDTFVITLIIDISRFLKSASDIELNTPTNLHKQIRIKQMAFRLIYSSVLVHEEVPVC